MNPKQAATSRPNSSNMDEGVANCDAVLFNTSSNLPATFVKVVLVAFSLSSHLTSIYPLYDRYERPATNTLHLLTMYQTTLQQIIKVMFKAK